MTSPNLDAEKAELRSQQMIVRKVASANADAVATSMAGLGGELITAFKLFKGDIVAGYWPIRTEIDPRPLMAILGETGVTTALPATPTPGAPLIFHQWQDGDQMIDGLYGTSEPSSDAPVCSPKLLLVPMLAFDDAGYRLGYGGGFYDRSLAALRERGEPVYAVGIAYDSQRVDEVPTGPYDAKLDGVLTDSGLSFFPKDD